MKLKGFKSSCARTKCFPFLYNEVFQVSILIFLWHTYIIWLTYFSLHCSHLLVSPVILKLLLLGIASQHFPKRICQIWFMRKLQWKTIHFSMFKNSKIVCCAKLMAASSSSNFTFMLNLRIMYFILDTCKTYVFEYLPNHLWHYNICQVLQVKTFADIFQCWLRRFAYIKSILEFKVCSSPPFKCSSLSIKLRHS